MKTPRVIVLMPVYNTAAYLPEAIESILNQTFTDFEFLIIDDASTDGSAAMQNLIRPKNKIYQETGKYRVHA